VPILKVHRCADELAKFCTAFQERRAKVTDEILAHFMTQRPLLCRGVPANTLLLSSTQSKTAATGPKDVADPNSKAQAKKQKKLEEAALKKAAKAREKEASSGDGVTAGVKALGVGGEDGIVETSS
jgi:tryptophanyl-tRNA synthetase